MDDILLGPEVEATRSRVLYHFMGGITLEKGAAQSAAVVITPRKCNKTLSDTEIVQNIAP